MLFSFSLIIPVACNGVIIEQLTTAAKGSLTIFWELFTVILCASKHLKRYKHHYLEIFGSQIETGGTLKIEKAILRFLKQTITSHFL